MIYQFEHEEIKQCEYCKLCDLNFDWCNMQSCLIDKYESPKFNNCPLVAISKTETTSCELLNHNMNYKKCSSCNYLIHVYVNKPNYCPNCGRKLKENER